MVIEMVKVKMIKIKKLKLCLALTLITLLVSTLIPAKASEWKSIGPDGGDMHFVYITRNHTVFASHGFGGLWRSEDGENWKLIYNPEFVNMNVMAMAELNGILFAGGNKGLWKSFDEGKTWSRIETGEKYIDEGSKYEIVSIVPLSENHIYFTARIDKAALFGGFEEVRNGFFELKDGELTFWEIPGYSTKHAVTMLAYDDNFSGREVLFVSSSDSGLYIFDIEDKTWNKILDKNTTRVSLDKANDTVYVGTIGDWYYVGRFNGNWSWEHITLDGECAVAEFIVPDPYNPERLWIGGSSGERGSLYTTDLRGDNFVGVGFWKDGEWLQLKIKGNWGITIAIDRNAENESEEPYVIHTEFGKGARIAYVPQAGKGCIQKTEDGGLTWRRAYNGIYGDTINKINYISSGVRKGDVVVTCVSGTQIAKDLGDSWEEGIDFTIGNIGYGLPGYAWGAASPREKLEGRYDLLIATGYPPTTLTGNGVYAVDTECLKSGGKGCMKRISAGPYFDLVVVGDKLYAGRMDEDVDVINLSDYSVQKIDVNGAGINIVYSGKIFISTERGGNRESDSYFFSDPRGEGSIYVCNVNNSCQEIYSGKRVVSFSVNGSRMLALTVEGKLIYWEDYSSNPAAYADLPSATYSDMVVDWEKGIVYVSTFDLNNKGVMFANISKALEGQLFDLGEGLLDKRVRDLMLVGNILFAGTEGQSVWRKVLPDNFEPFANFTFSPSLPNVNQPVTFLSLSYDPDGYIISYSWDFGDGSKETTANPAITHTYAEPGTYNVTLTVTDNNGLSSTTSAAVVVESELTKQQIKQQIISLIFEYVQASEEEKQEIGDQIIQLIFEYVKAPE